MLGLLETPEGRRPGLGPGLVGGSLGTPGGVDALCCVQLLSRVRLFVTPWTIAHQAPLATRFPRQQYWSGLPCPPPGDPPHPGIKPRSPTLQADSLPSEPPGKPWRSGCMNAIGQTRVPSLAGPEASFPQLWPSSGQGRMATAVGKEGFLGGNTLHYRL